MPTLINVGKSHAFTWATMHPLHHFVTAPLYFSNLISKLFKLNAFYTLF